MEKPPRPWYREFWPWFLMLFPATAVVAGFITFRIAAQSDDGVVDDDYYKQGLAINRVLARGQAAAAAGLSGVARFSGETVTVRLSGHPDAWPEQLVLRVLHP
ncbi:MAG: FixH family protein, partial [Burkholderiales bacterium]